MCPSPGGPSKRAAYWQDLVDQWSRSGQTQASFCRERGISYGSFNDSVVDGCDQCPNTPPGDPVDADGCSTADDDGDGLLNDRDNCPNTPAGTTVDANGCPTGNGGGGGGGGRGGDTPQDDGTVGAGGTAVLQVSDNSASAEVSIRGAPAGSRASMHCASENAHGFAGLDLSGAGVVPETLVIDSDLEPGTFVATIKICYDQQTLDVAGVSAADLIIHTWDESLGQWVITGQNNVGQSAPTGNVGDYGWNGNCVWVVVDRFSEFIGADQCPDDPDKTEPGVCGCGEPDIDTDGDGVADCIDNCSSVANSDQADVDGDEVGDVCDNCADVVNSDQVDTDGDGLGDVCDACPNDPDNDIDGDGVCGEVDNCPNVANPNQSDLDSDGFGDACQTVRLTIVGEAGGPRPYSYGETAIAEAPPAPEGQQFDDWSGDASGSDPTIHIYMDGDKEITPHYKDCPIQWMPCGPGVPVCGLATMLVLGFGKIRTRRPGKRP